MLAKKIAKKLTDQLGREFSASYIYLGMAAWFDERGWNGFAKWMERQCDEERGHAMRIYRYLLDQGVAVELPAIAAPPTKFKSVLEIFEKTLDAEVSVSKSYLELMAEVKKEQDFATEIFLQWFVTEQVEEEASVGNILDRLRIAADSKESLLILDKELGEEEGH